MKTSIIITKIIFILYFISCIGTEIWYLVISRNIRNYNYDENFYKIMIAFLDVFYFSGNIISIISILYRTYDDAIENLGYCMFVSLMSGLYSNLLVLRFLLLIPGHDRKQTLIDCDLNKIACRASRISCILGYSSIVFVYTLLIVMIIYDKLLVKLPNKTKKIINNLQRNLFVV
ncbi:hypothetical protein GLOIN_2v618243 [Rhizophagus clarus]|uniref:Uncharacterized protein n=1 Tax=Rhizophagus clarus TaxID=94130 RepID=A0A8H3L8R4_9GLOM|nr:hypothetical protein GLOIN_2v618243 [Rhizophagus clarus]